MFSCINFSDVIGKFAGYVTCSNNVTDISSITDIQYLFIYSSPGQAPPGPTLSNDLAAIRVYCIALIARSWLFAPSDGLKPPTS